MSKRKVYENEYGECSLYERDELDVELNPKWIYECVCSNGKESFVREMTYAQIYEALRDGFQVFMKRIVSTGVTKEMAKAFYEDLCGTVYGDPDKNSGGIMSAELVAEHMKITVSKAEEFLWACCHYGVTNRANGMFVI